MLGREDGNEPRKSLRASLTVKNKLPDTQAKRNHMKTLAAWISRHFFESLLEPSAIQSPGMPLSLMLPQSTTRSLAASTMAPMNAKRTVRASKGSCIVGRARAEMKKLRMPKIQASQATTTTNMVKLTAAVAVPAASMLEAMRFPMRPVRIIVHRSATRRRIILIIPMPIIVNVVANVAR